MSRFRVTQFILWPTLLIPTLTLIGVEFVAVGLGWVGWVALPVRLFVYSTGCVASVMTGMTRCLGPVSEAYRLGMSAGAREERQRAEREHDQAMPNAVGHDSIGWTLSAPAAPRPALSVVRGGRKRD